MKIIWIMAAIVLAGCAWEGQPSPTAQNFGRAYETVKYNQVLNPEAGNSAVSEDLGGRSSANLVEKYETTFKEKPREETVNILKLQ